MENEQTIKGSNTMTDRTHVPEDPSTGESIPSTSAAVPTPDTMSPSDLHGQSFVSPLSTAISPRPSVTILDDENDQPARTMPKETYPDELPERDEPPARTTSARLGRRLRGLVHGRNNESADIELGTLDPHASLSDSGNDDERTQVEPAHPAHTVQPLQSVQPGQSEQQSTPAEEPRMSTAERWTWIGCLVGAATFGTVMYVAISRDNK